MARTSYGDDVKIRVKSLFERLLAYANDELDNPEHYKIDFYWETPKQVIFRTKRTVLEGLTGLKKEQVREALNHLEDFLQVLEDLRVNKRGSEEWYFRLTLWHEKGDKFGNLRQFDAEWKRLREQKPGVQRILERQPKPTPTRYFNLPLSGVVEFVGREKELQTLHQMLQENSQVAIAAIDGMGGVGKTELALQYAMTHREIYKGGICWLLAKTEDVGVQVVRFARSHLDLNPQEDLDLLGQVQYCWQHWREGKVLLVLDDVTDFQRVMSYLPPQSSRFKVLITTRERFGKPIVRLDLDVLAPEAALELLKFFLGNERVERELDIGVELCQWLGYLPLGLELVGRYLEDESLSLSQMLERLKQQRLKHFSLREVDPIMTARLGVEDAFELSWKRLDENAQQLGCLLSLFALAPILWELVEKVYRRWQGEAFKLEELEKPRRDLIKLHLLKRDNETYRLHQLIREFFKDKLEEFEHKNFRLRYYSTSNRLKQPDELKQAFCQEMVALSKQIPQTITPTSVDAIAHAIPHIAEAAISLTVFMEEPLPDHTFVMSKKFRYVNQHPDLNSLDILAYLVNNLAYLYSFQERYSEAERLYIKALATCDEWLGANHPNTVIIRKNLEDLRAARGSKDKNRLW